eukprot:10580836-Prorocentrum_lima.AAC.1
MAIAVTPIWIASTERVVNVKGPSESHAYEIRQGTWGLAEGGGGHSAEQTYTARPQPQPLRGHKQGHQRQAA